MAWTTPKTWVAGSVLTAAELNTHVRDNLNVLKTSLTDGGHLEFVDAAELTIASGAITVTQNYHYVDTQDNDPSDDLDTITPDSGIGEGFVLALRVAAGTRTVVLKDGTGNLDLGRDVTLDENEKTFALIYDGANWRPLTIASFAEYAADADTVDGVEAASFLQGDGSEDPAFNTVDLQDAAPATPDISVLYIDSIITAWVTFDGTGTVAIYDDVNVGSITDNGAGDYTANFATSMAHANFAAFGIGQGNGGEFQIVSLAAGSMRLKDRLGNDHDPVCYLAVGGN